MLFLHIRFVDMDFCAFILLSSLPAAWLVVGCFLLFLLLVVTTLLFLKLREATMLKKEVLELRDTMRMMRYEEANLARMLHTVDKPADQPVSETIVSEGDSEEELASAAVEENLPVNESETEEKEQEQTIQVEEPEKEPLGESNECPIETSAEDAVEELVITHVDKLESTPEVPTEQLEVKTEGILEEALEVAQEEELEPVMETPVLPEPRKHAINERRPAIPTDLFAVWFAENEDASSEEVVEENNQVFEKVKPEEDEALAVSQTEVLENPSKPIAQNLVTESVIEHVVAVSEDAESLSVEENESPSEMSKEDERFRRKLERIVHTRLRNPNLNIDIIAAQLGLGRTNFYRKVRELMGMSPNDYLRKCRMERAAELLCTSELAVNDVCVQVGMPDAQYFSRVFKTYFGVSPSVYREQQQSIIQ